MRRSAPWFVLVLLSLVLAAPAPVRADEDKKPTPEELQQAEATALAQGAADTDAKRLAQIWARAWLGTLDPVDKDDLLRLIDQRYHYPQKAGLSDLSVLLRDPRMNEHLDKVHLKYRLLWKQVNRCKAKIEGIEGVPPEAMAAIGAAMPGMAEVGKLLFPTPLAEEANGYDVDIALDYDYTAGFAALPWMHFKPFRLVVQMTAKSPAQAERKKLFWLVLDPKLDPRIVKMYYWVVTAKSSAGGWARVTNSEVAVPDGTRHLVTKLEGFEHPFENFWLAPKSTVVKTYAPFKNGALHLLTRYQESGEKDVDLSFLEHAVNMGIPEDVMGAPGGPELGGPAAGGGGEPGLTPEQRKLYEEAMAAMAAGDYGKASALFGQIAASGGKGDLVRKAGELAAAIEKAGKADLEEAVSQATTGKAAQGPGKDDDPNEKNPEVVKRRAIERVQRLARQFAGSEVGEQAEKALAGGVGGKSGGQQPAGGATKPPDEREQAAAAALAEARAREQRGEYRRALKGYKAAAATWADKPSGIAAAGDAKRMAADRKIAAAIEKECQVDFDAAAALVLAKLYDQALDVLSAHAKDCPLESCGGKVRKRVEEINALK